MSLSFRNLTIDPGAPVAQWPTEAVQAAMERGDLGDWRRIVGEFARDPWGRTARQVEEILSFSRPYGVAQLMETALERARRAATADECRQVAVAVRAAVARSGLSKS